jgi:L-lactate dehydrogenase complex protein LldF
MNHCPVYGAVGGHAYGWVYPGPIGAVLTPGLIGIREAAKLPNASTFCGKCEAVCPMHIPLPGLMRGWREAEFDEGLTSWPARAALRIWAAFARHPWAYHRATQLAAAGLRLLAGRGGKLRSLPGAAGWTRHRDFPAPQGKTFQELWKAARQEHVQ